MNIIGCIINAENNGFHTSILVESSDVHTNSDGAGTAGVVVIFTGIGVCGLLVRALRSSSQDVKLASESSVIFPSLNFTLKETHTASAEGQMFALVPNKEASFAVKMLSKEGQALVLVPRERLTCRWPRSGSSMRLSASQAWNSLKS